MGRRRVAWATVVVLLVVGLGMVIAGAWPLLTPARDRAVHAVTPVPLTPAPSATATSPEATASTPTWEEVRAASPLQPVPLAPLVGLRIEGPELLIEAPVLRLEAAVALVDGVEVSIIDPPTTVDAYSWSARATEVGVVWEEGASVPTVVLDSDRAPEIFGHAGLGRGVFGNLTQLAVGDRIVLTTGAGELVYEVRGIHETPKGAAGATDAGNPLLAGTGDPGTVLVASCVPNGPGGTSTTAAVYTGVLVASRPQG